MKTSIKKTAAGAALAVLLLTLAGCSTPSAYKQADQTGESINEFRNDVAQIKVAVDGSMKALDKLEASASTDPRKAFEAFSKSVDKVAAAGKTAKKQSEDMQQRGQAYFDQWQEQLASVKNEDIRKLSQDRKVKLQGTFVNIKSATETAKQSFVPYLDDLKDLRTALSADITVEGMDAAKDVFVKTKAAGDEVERNLDTLITELTTVMATITAAKAPAN